MPNFLFCAKCGSDRIVTDAKTLLKDYGSTVQVSVDANPGAMMIKGTVRASLSARICATCGFTEFYADNLDALWDAHEQAQRHR
ncbi:MAG: hypothetical protein AAF624_06290 [Bacteroidota bacterium]